jgi:chemotaxis protein CheD
MTIFLGPGDYFFGSTSEQISTLLGSCVSLVAWLPDRQLLSVSHVMLPKLRDGESQSLRYGDVALSQWMSDAKKIGLRPQDFSLALFGGSTRFYSAAEYEQSIGHKNIIFFRDELRRLGLRLKCEETGGHYHRKLLVDAVTGRFWWQHLGNPESPDYQEGTW